MVVTIRLLKRRFLQTYKIFIDLGICIYVSKLGGGGALAR